MDIFQGIAGFEWDKGNMEKSRQKHGVRSSECEEVFFNSPFVVNLDAPPHSEIEVRYFALGKTDVNRLLFIAFTIRKNKIRVISARDMSRKERRIYHEKTEEDTEVQE